IKRNADNDSALKSFNAIFIIGNADPHNMIVNKYDRKVVSRSLFINIITPLIMCFYIKKYDLK
ncbi:hypothetical protein, partial [Enterobacter hormaechei]|uniref:hypothetical protein n=1 Tax=Enterobacter hormaechei TaxID=158836 RepID=UPI001C402F58